MNHNEQHVNRKPGRPRDKQIESRVLQAARELILEKGIQHFSMDRLAARSGVSKPTIYRRWPTKEDVLSDSFGDASEQAEIPDTGDAWLDIQTLFGRMLSTLNSQFAAQPTAAKRFIAAVIDIDPIRERYLKNFIVPRRRAYAEIIQRGKTRGQIQKDANEDILIDLVSGAYFYCLTFMPEKLSTDDWLKETMRILATGLKA